MLWDRTMRRILTASLVALAACSTPPRYERPAVEVPPAWKESGPRYAEDGRWWRIYGDPTLDALIDEAFARNTDLAIAAARVDEARAIVADARGAQLPTLDARAAASRQQISARTATAFPGIPREYSDYRAALNVSWELDLFGRLRAGVAAARADLAASEAAREGVRLALAAQVATSYFALRAFDEQVDLTRRNVQLREDALALQRKRYNGGVISEFDLRQLEAEAAAVRAQLPPLERQRDAEEAALAVLLGRTPRQIYEDTVARTARFDESPGGAVPPSGMPSELLLRRPDLVQAERQIAAANARVAAARADMFPSIVLTGFAGRESAALSNLFTGPAGIWQIAAGVTQPIFAGGRLEARTDAARARERQALAQYQKTIQTAFSEVRTAITAQSRSRESYDAESARASALADAVRLARLRYQNGVASQLDVIDAERGLLAAQSARIEALRAHRAAIADLFRALGG
ncbi:MAG: efflux transporter outer membrane subunit [Betaproteobacteria bacterium]|nr:MAG: efflux transporter outer membrane subunit [Betaproteobacteria bacterium]